MSARGNGEGSERSVVAATDVRRTCYLGEPVHAVVGVGVVSGLYPAWRAADVDPIEALRRE